MNLSEIAEDYRRARSGRLSDEQLTLLFRSYRDGECNPLVTEAMAELRLLRAAAPKDAMLREIANKFRNAVARIVEPYAENQGLKKREIIQRLSDALRAAREASIDLEAT